MRPVIKVCGMTAVADAARAIEYGATAIGVILASSPRQCDVDVAREIVALVNASGRDAVGVFRGQGEQEIVALTELLGLSNLQLHDELTPSLRESLGEVRVWRAIHLAPGLSGDGLTVLERRSVEHVLYDAAQPGSGVVANWNDMAHRSSQPFVVAGGLTPANVAEAAAIAGAIGVDVASGVESSVGKKDVEAMRAFIVNAREAFALKDQAHQ